MTNPNPSPENQFKPGQSGNPNGKVPGTKNLTTKLREALDRIHEGSETPYDELLVNAIIKDALKVDGQSRRLIFQYLEGMPKQAVEMEVGLPQTLIELIMKGGEKKS